MTPADAEALFTEIEYVVLRKAAGYDRGELAACKGKFLWLTRLASIPPNTPAPSDDEIRKVWNRTQDPIATVRAFVPDGVMASPAPQQAVQCAFCERSMLAGSECLKADQAATCDARAAGVGACPACGGNDKEAPCAFPEGGQPGCLRDKRIAGVAVPRGGDALGTLEAALEWHRGDKWRAGTPTEAEAWRAQRERLEAAIEALRAGVQGTVNPACGVHGPIPCEGAQCICAAGVPACQPTEAQYQRRQGIRNLDGELEWRSWQVCTQKEAARIDGLSSWQWRKVTIPAAGVKGPQP